MRDENAYKRHLWAWFASQAYKPGQWGSKLLSSEESGHLASCGIDVEYSSIPEISTVTEWGNTFNPNVTVPAITVPGGWRCNCGEYGSENLTLYITGTIGLGEIISGVLEKAEEQA